MNQNEIRCQRTAELGRLRQSHAKLLAACKTMVLLAEMINSNQHAGRYIPPQDWAALWQATKNAEAAIAEAQKEIK